MESTEEEVSNLTVEEAAQFLTKKMKAEIKPETMKRWPYMGKGPRIIKIGANVRYDKRDLLEFIEESKKDPRKRGIRKSVGTRRGSRP
jgi:hypothetical protein